MLKLNLTGSYVSSSEETRDSLIAMLLNLPFPDFDLIDELKLPPTVDCREEEIALDLLNADTPNHVFWGISEGLYLDDAKNYTHSPATSVLNWGNCKLE